MAVPANQAWYVDSELRLEAEGYQWDRNLHVWQTYPDPNRNPAVRNPNGLFRRNGGIMVKRRVLLAEDNVMYRFAAQSRLDRKVKGRAQLLPVLNSAWWMERERMQLLLNRANEARVPLVEMARRQLALPTDWTDADIVVRVNIRPGVLLAAHAGPGLKARGSDSVRIVAHEAPHTFTDQLYVPGLGWHPVLLKKGPANASDWFDPDSAIAFDPRMRGLNP